ncbi:unnamed protein product, partial [Larinioides sclopetarius]
KLHFYRVRGRTFKSCCNVIADAYNVIFTLQPSSSMSNGAFKSMQRFIPDAKNLTSTLNWYPLSVSCLDNLHEASR